jgi:hypothetical protein
MPKRATSTVSWHRTVRDLQADVTTAQVHLYQAMANLADTKREHRTHHVDSSFWRRTDRASEQISHVWADLGTLVNDIGEAEPDE